MGSEPTAFCLSFVSFDVFYFFFWPPFKRFFFVRAYSALLVLGLLLVYLLM